MRLIDADALLEDIRRKKKSGYPKNKNLSLYAASCVLHAPTVDPAKRGKWVEWWPGISLIITGEEVLWRCSVCDAKFPDNENMRYCPYCGAKMDLE